MHDLSLEAVAILVLLHDASLSTRVNNYRFGPQKPITKLIFKVVTTYSYQGKALMVILILHFNIHMSSVTEDHILN